MITIIPCLRATGSSINKSCRLLEIIFLNCFLQGTFKETAIESLEKQYERLQNWKEKERKKEAERLGIPYNSASSPRQTLPEAIRSQILEFLSQRPLQDNHPRIVEMRLPDPPEE